MIVSFKHKGLKRLCWNGDKSAIRPDLLSRVESILFAIDNAREIAELNAPGFRLHPLTGDLKGYWSVWVRANWRVIFRFAAGEAYDVELIDYH